MKRISITFWLSVGLVKLVCKFLLTCGKNKVEIKPGSAVSCTGDREILCAYGPEKLKGIIFLSQWRGWWVWCGVINILRDLKRVFERQEEFCCCWFRANCNRVGLSILSIHQEVFWGPLTPFVAEPRPIIFHDIDAPYYIKGWLESNSWVWNVDSPTAVEWQTLE